LNVNFRGGGKRRGGRKLKVEPVFAAGGVKRGLFCLGTRSPERSARKKETKAEGTGPSGNTTEVCLYSKQPN